MLESKFQSDLIDDLEDRFKGCIVLKNDAGYIQGFPDLTILYQNMWAVLECKKNQILNDKQINHIMLTC